MKEIEMKIEEIKKFRRHYNDTHATNYDKEWWGNEDALDEYKSFKRLIHVQLNDIVLDIATGTGTFLIEVAKLGGIWYGVDQSPNMLAQLKQKINQNRIEYKIKEIQVCVADLLPYPDLFFDWVTCIGMFEYYPLKYVKQVFDEIIRVLKLTGKCIVDIPNPYDNKTKNMTWIYRHNLDEFENLVKSSGLIVLEKRGAGYMFQYLLSRTKI